mgnify:CR=1 FL=1
MDDKSATRDRILQAAMTRIKHYGYGKTTMAEIAADYEKVRCIVNAADAEVAKAIAVRVCAHVARGEARNVEVIQDVRSTYKGSGFWVRVYAKG